MEAALAAGLLGLLIGSFLNVVIHRMPTMLCREWLTQALTELAPPREGTHSLWSLVFGSKADTPPTLETAAAQALVQVEALEPLSLSTPRSRCSVCGHPIHWYENVPVLSYLLLRGRC